RATFMLVPLALCAAITALLFLLLLARRWGVFQYVQPRATKWPSPPRPPGLPFFGNVAHMARTDLHIHLTQLARTYGAVYCLRVGGEDIVVLNNVESIKEMLIKKSADFAGRPQTYAGGKITGGGKDIALGDYSAVWRRQRRAALSALHCVGTARTEEIVQGEAQRLVEDLTQYIGRPTDIHTDISMRVCNVICSVAFGTKYDKHDTEFLDIHCCLDSLVRLWGSPAIRALDCFPVLRLFPNPAWRDLMAAVRKRDEVVWRQILLHKAKPSSSPSSDMTDFLLKFTRHSRNEEESEARGGILTEERVHLSIMDTFIAGVETTATLIEWALAYLVLHPEVQDQIYEEMEQKLQPGLGPSLADRDKLLYLDATIKEILRLCPVAPLAIPHRALRDSSVGGFFICKGSTVIANLWAAHRDHAHWDNPSVFQPGRFLGESLERRNPASLLLPFGAGKRVCLGESLAKAEIFLFLGHVLRRLRLQPAGSPPDLSGQLAIVPKQEPFQVYISPRVPYEKIETPLMQSQ
uniref:Steroid 21-hydroxylase n=1 Tax=Petromyzon marinus TaxID=7757 RepID=S4RRW7_PETMA